MDWKTRIPAFFLWIFLLLSSIEDGNAEKRVVCYYTNWSVYRPGTAKFSPQNINPYLCTHLIYAFGGFTKDNTLKPFDKYQDIEKGGYAKFTGLKTYNKDLKTMLAIGGWNEGSSRFSPMVADPGRRKDFVKNSIKFLRQNHFDGLDLDWEYPAFRDGGKPRDKNNYADLVQELREEFERESSKTGRPRLLLSMAVPAGIEYIDKGYDIPRLNDYLDFMNLLSYDYHSAYEPAANHHSPLYPLEEDNEYNYDSELTIDYTIEHLLKSGATSDKIVLGIPTYGRSYTLFNEDATDIGAPADGPGEEGDATREKGYLAYYEICESIAKTDEWQVVQPNPKAMGPYAFRGNQWVGYDDEAIVRAKARYVNEKKLGGIMFWSIDNDDFRGKCHGRPYPLIEAAKEALLIGDERSDSGTKTRFSDSRKKTRIQGGQRNQGSSTGRKFITGRRSTTTESSASRRRVNSSRTNGRSRARAKSRDSEDEEENNEEEVNSVKSAEKSRPGTRVKDTRSKNRLPGSGRRKQQNSGQDDETKFDEEREESRINKLTTPEPPTTPDPGTDFKCEDEGFFSHPRDCKKYFWCLDSGPGGLGIVAHQFTCPSGLVFNKAADSCDYPRNVVCPKTKPQQSTVTTTRAPITAATSRTTYLHKPTQRTSTPKSDSEEEYEYYDEDDDENANDSREIEEEVRSTTTARPYKTINRSRPTTTTSAPTTTTETARASTTRPYKTSIDKATSFEDEEDPRVIKELIDLIKKAGGIEQLEKQLHYQEKNSAGNFDKVEENGQSTPATISRSLYERVLNRQATRIAGGFLGSLSNPQSSKGDKSEQGTPTNSRTTFVNGPGGAQFEGLDQVPEVKSLRRTTKHQYVTIDRQRPSTSESPTKDDEEIDEEDDDDNRDVASSEDQAVSDSPQQKPSNRRVTPSYVNIRRSRPSTTTSENDVDQKDEDEENSDDTEENQEKEDEELATENHRITKTEEEPLTPKSRYTNAQRFRSTTLRQDEEKVTEKAFVKNDPTTLTSTSTTTTEKVVPVTENISEIPVTFPSTLQPQSTEVESSMKLDISTRIHNSNLEEKLLTVNPETTEPSNAATLSLVENSATEILFTTVPASSISTGSSYDSFTREPSIPAVSQPRPFGFSRRGRPTTTSSSTTSVPTVVASVTEQTRSKVDSDTLRLPTLKELVGLTTTLLNDESTSELPQSSTNSVIDTTIEINAPSDDSDDRGYQKNNVDHQDTLSEEKNFSDSDGPMLVTRIDSDISDNDILGSEEIQNRSPSTSFVNADDREINRSSNHEEDNEKSKTSLRRVEVPVKILDDNNGEEIAELVLLRVPESKFNSAILKPVFRVKILEREGHGDRGRIVKTKKLRNSSDSSLENELSDNFRSISGNRRRGGPSTFDGADTTGTTDTAQSRPRNRQRIIKARRRTRPLISNDQDDHTANAPGKASSFQDNEDSTISKSLEKMEIPPTTEMPGLSESPATLRATTIRGNRPSLLKLSNSTRGFYVTRNIDETSTVTESTSTDFTESTQYSTMTVDDISDDSTPEVERATQKIDVTTDKPDFTNEIIETIIPQGPTIYSTTEGSTTMESAIFPIMNEQFTARKLETTTPDYLPALEDELTESSGPSITITEESTVKAPEITTFRHWTTGQVTTTNSITSIEPTTREYSTDGSTIIENNNIHGKIEETTKNGSEILMTSENSHWRTSTLAETKNTISPSKTVNNDEEIEFKTKRFEVEGATETAGLPSERNNVRRKSSTSKSAFETTTVPIKRVSNKNDENSSYQTERTMPETTNLIEETTIHRGSLKRGGIRYTTSSKPPSTIGLSSETREQSRRTTKTSRIDDHRNISLGEQVLPVTRPSSTGPHDTTTKSTESQELTRLNSNLQNRSSSLPPNSRSTSRRRNNVRKTTKSLEPSEKTTSPAYPGTTEVYDEENKITVSGGSSLTTSRKGETAHHAQSPRSFARGRNDATKTTKSSGTIRHGSDPSTPEKQIAEIVGSTEAYGNTLKITTNSLTSYLITNSEEGTENPPDARTTTSSENNKIEINTTNRDESFETKLSTTEAYVKTSLNDEDTFITESFENNIENKSLDSEQSLQKSFDDLGPRINSTNPDEYFDESSMTTSSDPIAEIMEVTTDISRIDYLTTNYADTSINSDSASGNFDSYSKTTGSFMTESSSNYTTVTREESIETSASTEVYNGTMEYESKTVQLDYPTTSSPGANNRRFYTTIMISDRTGKSSTTEAYDKITETTDSPNIMMTDEIASSEEDRSESTKMHETTVSYDEISTPWLYRFPINFNNTTTNIDLENFDSSTVRNPSTDREEFFIANTHEVSTNNQTIAEFAGAISGNIQSSFSDGKNDTSTEPNLSSITKSITIKEKMNSSVTGLSSLNDSVTNATKSTTTIYEGHSMIDSLGNIPKPEIEGKSKRTRGRVRFTTFVGNFNDTNDSNRRPVKQVVVRRRLAKDRYKNATTPEPAMTNTEVVTTEKNRATEDEIKNGYSMPHKNERINSENIKDEDKKIEEAKSSEDESNDRLPEGKITSPKSMRRRVVVYRGRPRAETTMTTVKPTTTTVQSSSLSSNEITDDKRRRRRKWRKKIVLKRGPANVEEEDQSIAETSDVRRALINDEMIEEFHDDFSDSYVIVPPEIEGISKHEDIAGEVNIFKNSGGFLRRPGTLVRNDALNRLRSKNPNTSIPKSQPTAEPPPFSRIKSGTDTSYEIKTDDQSVRAQEVAVTLSDPPAIDSSSTTGRVGLRKQGTKKISTTVAPRTEAPTHRRTTPIVRRRNNNPGSRNDNSRVIEPHRPRRPSIIDYDYYVDDEIRLVLKPELKDKLYVTQKGGIRCLDQGNFAHPTSCKKFITCARMVNGQVIGTEYTCPDKLSFDPVGGICNWSAGLGCEEKNKS